MVSTLTLLGLHQSILIGINLENLKEYEQFKQRSDVINKGLPRNIKDVKIMLNKLKRNSNAPGLGK